jgi:hypothetical protein
MSALSQFGVEPFKLMVQLILSSVVFVVPATVASVKVVRHYRSFGARLLWLSLIWCLPVVGAVTALIWVPRNRVESRPLTFDRAEV